MIKDEVLKITSEDTRHGNVYTKSYPVADLVIPIPNFGPDGHMGMNAALQEGYNRAGYGGGPGGGGASTARSWPAQRRRIPTRCSIRPSRPKSEAGRGPVQHATNSGRRKAAQPQPSGYGPGGARAATGRLRFAHRIDHLDDRPDQLGQSGGPGSIAQFQTNLSLVISQTQEVHEQIADLLNQLRRLQDLQVTIEVRFITLDDDYFERIGVDFKFDIPQEPRHDPA